MTLPFHNSKCFELNIEMRNEDSRKRKTAELNSVLAKEHWVPKTGDNTHADAKQRMLQKAGGFYQSPTLFCGNCKSSDASSSRFVLRLEGSQIILSNLGFFISRVRASREALLQLKKHEDNKQSSVCFRAGLVRHKDFYVAMLWKMP